MILRFLALMAVLTTAAQAQPVVDRAWSYVGPPDKEAVSRRVVEVLIARCPRIKQALPDIVSFEAEYRRLQPFDPRYKAGHRILIEGGPILADRAAKVIPRPPFIPGDHALFEVLGPPRSGVNMDKALALWLCDAPPPPSGGVTFLPMPEMEFVGR